MTLLRDARITRDSTCWEAMERQGIGCVAPVISLQKLKNFLVQPKFRSLTQHGPGSSGDETRSGGMDTSQMHSMYGNRTGGNSTSPPVSTSNSALLVVPQPINAASKPPSLTATNCTGRKYQCKMCPQIFMHKSAMQHHSREIHRGEIKPHQCQQCLKSFSSNHQLTQHIRIHTGEKPYKCSYCDRRFKQLSHVQQHTRLHTGERPYKCHLANCGRAFIQLSNLQQHLRNHDNQMERAKNRPYLCNICGKGFASESSLRTHRSKACSQGWGQMGQNPLKFSVTPPNVESEARRNTTESKSTGFNNTSEQHAALIGGANSQSCPVCHKICLNGEALMEHMRTTHKDPNASGTPSKKKRGRSSRSSAATTTTSNGDSVRNTSPLSSTVLGIRVSTSKHSLTAISNSLTSSALTAVSTTAVCGSGSARGIMSTMGMSMSNFLVPSMVGSSTFGGHSGGPTQGCHYPHHPLVARPQPSFLSL